MPEGYDARRTVADAPIRASSAATTSPSRPIAQSSTTVSASPRRAQPAPTVPAPPITAAANAARHRRPLVRDRPVHLTTAPACTIECRPSAMGCVPDERPDAVLLPRACRAVRVAPSRGVLALLSIVAMLVVSRGAAAAPFGFDDVAARAHKLAEKQYE